MSFDPKQHVIKQKESTETRFKRYVGTPTESGCLEWSGGISSNGYGVFWRDGKTVSAHREAWEAVNGAIPDGLYICHRCDNRKCVNVEHMFLGTCADNIHDCVSKNRRNPPLGSRHYAAKLTEAQVIEIRRRRASGERAKAIASLFSVHPNTVNDIAKRRIWKNVL